MCTYEDLLKILKKSTLAKVIKPQQAAGSRGVFLIDYKTLSDNTIFKFIMIALGFVMVSLH